MQANGVVEELCSIWIQKCLTSPKTKMYIICMIKNVYFLYNYSINCWGRIDPKPRSVNRKWRPFEG